MKFIVRRASQFYRVDPKYSPCDGAVLEDIKYTNNARSEKVWTIELSDYVKGLLDWTELQGGRIVIEKEHYFDLYVITIYDYYIE